MYSEEELLMLSGIQHFAFCPRQWALIHIEQQWDENRLTTEGSLMHSRADDPTLLGMFRNKVILRSVNIVSYKLGLYGVSDIIELTPSVDSSNAFKQKGYEGYWRAEPVEYKRGKSKPDERDWVQVMAQGICLEEMYDVTLERGWVFYGEMRHREEVLFTRDLRIQTKGYAERMHEIYASGRTPRAEYKAHCRSCSLADICLPKKLDGTLSANDYLKKVLSE
ncbi:MAG: CRISPR-associated protein Cas4 [Bacteroidales bacterium]|nr:CRISPR-associated protein Cas4 [Bacteroidales bacterium]